MCTKDVGHEGRRDFVDSNHRQREIERILEERLDILSNERCSSETWTHVMLKIESTSTQQFLYILEITNLARGLRSITHNTIVKRSHFQADFIDRKMPKDCSQEN